ncbi:ABC transporter ATP-binding protein [Eubacterium ruminantium]|uniref:ABC transporter ATP-binding protein n=1 Tax=Eubacterium ruminantium TaxID=42322 RepID=UPI0015697B06|nr:ATP-binding cassette domain-containing protein [Eubacterium ruminantium]
MGLVVKDLFKKYGDKTVVDHISFRMDKPGVYALLGTNGAGKTTSIRMILDMLDKNGGEVIWNDGPLNFDTCNIGYLAEERGLYPKYSLMDQIKYFGTLRGVPEKELDKKIKYWAERLKVEEYLYPQYKDAVTGNKINEHGDFIDENGKVFLTTEKRKRVVKKKIKPQSPDQLSKGNQQKIQFLIAMLSDPDLIVLDEPFSGLDPVNTDILKNVVREQIDAGKYIIMSSHQMEVVEEFCTDITILSRSKAVVQGNLNDIKKSYGRVNLNLKCEENVDKYINEVGAEIVSEKENEYKIKVKNDEQSQKLLKLLVDNKVNVIRFDLSELSLHEIFVKEVGADEK